VPASVGSCRAAARQRGQFARFGRRLSVHFGAEIFLQLTVRVRGKCFVVFRAPVCGDLTDFQNWDSRRNSGWHVATG
jgi:hypothetical protein